MRRFILYAIASLLIVSSGSVAPANLSYQGTHDPCDAFKMVIITPPKDIDFKMIIIPVPKNLDKAMVINPCPQSNPSVVQSTVIIPTESIIPGEKKDGSIKAPPVPIENIQIP